jgi:hypothetical protein
MPSNDEIQATLCAPGQFFEIETVHIRGVPTRAGRVLAVNVPARSVDDGDLEAGDIVLQRGTNHLWRAVGTEPLRMSTVMVAVGVSRINEQENR